MTFETEPDKGGIWLHSDNGGTDSACAFIQHLQFEPTGSTSVSQWSHDCSKPPTDAYGGGRRHYHRACRNQIHEQVRAGCKLVRPDGSPSKGVQHYGRSLLHVRHLPSAGTGNGFERTGFPSGVPDRPRKVPSSRWWGRGSQLCSCQRQADGRYRITATTQPAAIMATARSPLMARNTMKSKLGRDGGFVIVLGLPQ